MFHPRKLMATALVVTVSAVALVFALSWNDSGQTRYTTKSNFPTKLQTRVQITESGTRVVSFFPNSEVPRHAIIHHKGGNQTHQWYYESGKLKEAKTQAPDGQNGWITIRHAFMDTDGKTFISDTEFHTNLALKKVLKLEEPGVTTIEYFTDKNRLEKRQRAELREQKWLLVLEDVLGINGELLSRLRVDKEGAYTSEQFSETGVITASRTINKYGGELVDKTFYTGSDAVKRLVKQARHETHVTYLRPDGTRIMKVHHMGEIGKATMVIDFFGEDDVKTHYQWWDNREGQYILWRVMVYKPNGALLKDVIFKGDGKTIGAEIFPLTDLGEQGEHYLRNYRDDGTLETITHRDKDRKELGVEHFTAAAGIKPAIESAMTEMPEKDTPPQILEFVPMQGP